MAALTARLDEAPRPAPAPVTDNPVIAYFPQAWQSAPESEWLHAGYHDVPWSDPALVRELIRPAYAQLGLLARLYAWSGWRHARYRVGGDVLTQLAPAPDGISSPGV